MVFLAVFLTIDDGRRKAMKKKRLVLMMVLVSSLLVGCGTKKETNNVKITPGEVKVETKEGEKAIIKTGKDGEGTIKIEGEDADGNKKNIEFFSDAKLPDDFPKEIPIPKKAEILTSNKVLTDEGQMLQVVYEINEKEMNLEAVTQLYRDFLTKNDYKIELEMTVNEMMQITATKEEKTFFQISIAQEDQLINVSLTLTQGI